MGFVPLTDCAPLVMAQELGLFRKFGLRVTLERELGWATVRDKIIYGELDAAHALAAMPVAATLGLGSIPCDCLTGLVLNLNGNAITLSNDLWNRGVRDGDTLREEIKRLQPKTTLTFGVVFPFSSHRHLLRKWLSAHGIDAERDVRIVVVPPPQMVANMKIGKMDGFCVGEPWNARAITDGIGYTSVSTQDMWKDHPEKVCAFLGEFADKNPKTVKAVLKALNEASVWLDNMDNRPEQCALVSKPTYINCDAKTILGRLQGHYDYGDGRTKEDPNYMIYSQRNCNYPQLKYAKWFLAQYRRWGLVTGAPDYEGIAKKVMRPDIYEEAMKEIGYTHGGADNSAETLFDGATFDPAGDLEAYAKSFAMKNLKG